MYVMAVKWSLSSFLLMCRTEHRSSDQRYAPPPGADGSRLSQHATLPSDIDDAVRLKIERIQQLRQRYQQTHLERQGRYLHDDLDDMHEQQLTHYEQVSLPATTMSTLGVSNITARGPVYLAHHAFLSSL